MSLRWLGVLLGLGACLGGCRSSNSAPGLADQPAGTGSTSVCVDHDGDGYGAHCALGADCDDENAAITRECYACIRPAPGCPCSSEGARTSCGKIAAQTVSQTTCAYGESVCASGAWSDCTLDGKSVRSFPTARRTAGLAGPSACTANICDPYCQQFADTPDDSLSTPSGIVGSTAGLTLAVVDAGTIQPDGPMPPDIEATIAAAGLAPSSPAAIVYHELLPGLTSTDAIASEARGGADVYFLDYTVGQDSNPVREMMDYARAGGLADQIRSAVPGARFGAGHYEQYDEWPWNGTGSTTVPFEHLLSMTSDPAALAGAASWLGNQFRDSFPMPRSWAPALFALSTTGGLRADRGYFVPPRSAWASPLGGDGGSCPAGTLGYPCFRAGATPITIVLADSPSSNGPGGQYAYERSNAASIGGARRWSSVTPVRVAGNGSEDTARAIDVGSFAIYTGDTGMSGNANQTWDWDDFDDCRQGFYRARNVFFSFHATGRAWFHFDTIGSDYNTVLYLYRAGGAGIACNVQSPLDGSGSGNGSSIDGVVDSGDYYVVVDGLSGDSGDYVLHVNAMPDGTPGPVSAPSYDEAVLAYNTIGGKIIGVDWSGYSCHDGPSSFVQRNTGGALEKLALDTNSVDAAGHPYVVHLDPFGGSCIAGDAPAESQIVTAVLGLTGRRLDITARAVDLDDSIDFDGPPGGSNQLTPFNIDDASFVASLTPIATPESMASCQGMTADRFLGCAPGTRVQFGAVFQVPPSVPASSHAQIFTFALRLLGDGTSVLAETPVVLVVPPSPPHHDAWFVRDYDTAGVCAHGTAPVWSTLSWDSTTPGDSRIDFEVAVASSAAELDSAPFDALVFTDPPGPSSLAGQAAFALDGTIDTQQGGAVVDTTLLLNDRPRDSPSLRMRAHLLPSSDRLLAPMLENWKLEVSCQPAE